MIKSLPAVHGLKLAHSRAAQPAKVRTQGHSHGPPRPRWASFHEFSDFREKPNFKIMKPVSNGV
jgi:hypothetical protein